ncbi:MAG TPA: polymer-forming cytoskeletal protein [Solirubrobacterales bacterium]|nr:polymer-forming cytoskeletal protein [Solirubrobacterales bacterium]
MLRVPSLVVLLALFALALPAAGAAQTSEHAEDAIVVISGDVTVPRGHTVEGIVVISGDVRLAGHVDGDVVLVSGDALVSGSIDGSLVTIGGQARLLPSAHVDGNVHYADERPVVAGEAIVRGDISREDGLDSLDLLPFISVFFLWLAIGVSMAILGLLLLLIAPRAAAAIEERSHERIGPLIAIGFAVAIALPVAAAIAAVTLVGLPLSFAIFFALAPLWAIAYCVSAWVLGRRLVKPPRNHFLAFLAGLGVLRLLALIPVLGLVVGLAAGIFGLGLIGAAIGAARDRPQPAPSPGS